MNGKMLVWRVRVGDLYYVQGLARYIKDITQKHKNLEMTTYRDAAFLFLYENLAENLAQAIGGVVEKVVLDTEEYVKLMDIHEYHVHSESDWNRYANEGLLEDIMKERNQSQNPQKTR